MTLTELAEIGEYFDLENPIVIEMESITLLTLLKSSNELKLCVYFQSYSEIIFDLNRFSFEKIRNLIEGIQNDFASLSLGLDKLDSDMLNYSCRLNELYLEVEEEFILRLNRLLKPLKEEISL